MNSCPPGSPLHGTGPPLAENKSSEQSETQRHSEYRNTADAPVKDSKGLRNANRKRGRTAKGKLTVVKSTIDYNDPNLSELLIDLKVFLQVAPALFGPTDMIKQFLLPTGETVSCIKWDDIFYITGTDIVRSLSYRLNLFGRDITNQKKFEEGIFSDLRNLKANSNARLEEAKSAFLEFLFSHQCVRTKKKQKVFYWYSVRHERLFSDALERELRKEHGQSLDSSEVVTTEAVAEPAKSFSFNPRYRLSVQSAEFIKSLPTPLAGKVQASMNISPRLYEAMNGPQQISSSRIYGLLQEQDEPYTYSPYQVYLHEDVTGQVSSQRASEPERASESSDRRQSSSKQAPKQEVSQSPYASSPGVITEYADRKMVSERESAPIQPRTFFSQAPPQHNYELQSHQFDSPRILALPYSKETRRKPVKRAKLGKSSEVITHWHVVGTEAAEVDNFAPYLRDEKRNVVQDYGPSQNLGPGNTHPQNVNGGNHLHRSKSLNAISAPSTPRHDLPLTGQKADYSKNHRKLQVTWHDPQELEAMNADKLHDDKATVGSVHGVLTPISAGSSQANGKLSNSIQGRNSESVFHFMSEERPDMSPEQTAAEMMVIRQLAEYSAQRIHERRQKINTKRENLDTFKS